MLLVLVVGVIVSGGAQAAVNKCCPVDERLSYRRQCMIAADRHNNTDDDSWYYDPAAAITQRCHPQDIDLIILTEDSNVSVVEDGSLRLSQDLAVPVGLFCTDRLPDDTIVFLTCPCSGAVCVHKCCHPPLVLHIDTDDDRPTASAMCRPPPPHSITWSHQLWTYHTGGSSRRPLYEMHGNPLCEVEAAQYIVDRGRGVSMSHLHVTADGGLRLPGYGYFGARQFCADVAVSEMRADSHINVIACRFRLRPTTRQQIFGLLYIIGTVFLFLTVLVHLLFPQLRKTAQAYIMIAYCTSLALAYISNAIIIFAGVNIQGTIYCRLLGVTIQGGFLAAFLWLNVMCIDIAATFRGLHLSKNSGETQKRRKFVAYCFYVNGLTALIIWLTIITQNIQSGGSSSVFANENCWFNDVTSATIFFFFPLGISQFINIVLFITTALKIYKAQRQTAKQLSRDGSGRHTGKKPYSNQDKRRLFLFVKLFFLMGLTWTFEVISATFDENNKLWYITDTINMLSGVIIFAMFCCKRKVIKLFLDIIKCSSETETCNSQKAIVSPKMSNSSSTRSTSINVYNIDTANRNEIPMTSSPNYKMSYL